MTPEFLRTAPGEEPVIVEGQFRAPPARVFRAWTDPADVKRWFGLKPPLVEIAEIDLRVGGQWRFTFGASDGRQSTLGGNYLAITPNEALDFTWRHELAKESGPTETSPDSEVSVTFREVAVGAQPGTHLRLVHRAISNDGVRLGVGNGWNASFARLETIL